MQTIITEKNASKINGFGGAILHLILIALEVLLVYLLISERNIMLLWLIVPLTIINSIFGLGFTIVQPNDSKVLIFFGKYIGTVKDSGFWFVNPLTIKKEISLRIMNFNSEKIKVNDQNGNPIELAAVTVWKVVDSARAFFDVQDYKAFVDIQSETAIRALASEFPYDTDAEDKISLRGNPLEVAERLKSQTQERLDIAGVEVIESRISYLAYAPEIAQAMLKRQQAQAIVAARQKIVDGAVGMVESALKALSEQKIVDLDEDKKATMVNNLMVALVSEKEAQPIINTGTIY